jgi:hypothetical protein
MSGFSHAIYFWPSMTLYHGISMIHSNLKGRHILLYTNFSKIFLSCETSGSHGMTHYNQATHTRQILTSLYNVLKVYNLHLAKTHDKFTRNSPLLAPLG